MKNERISISEQVDSLRAKGKNKSYWTTLREHSFEMGVGCEGLYPAHAHQFLTDVIVTFEGIRIPQPLELRRGGGTSSCQPAIVIVPPRTWFGPVQVGSFLFLKFLAAECSHFLPDKIREPGSSLLEERSIECLGTGDSGTYGWFRPCDSSMARIEVSVSGVGVQFHFGGGHSTLVGE